MARAKDKAKELKEKYKIDDDDLKLLMETFDGDIGEVSNQLKAAAEAEIGKWTNWYRQNAGAIEANERLAEEAVALKAKFAELEKAGIRLNPEPEPNKPNTPAELDVDKLKGEIYGVSSQIMKELTQVGLRHYNNFKEELDLDAVEKVVREKGLTVKAAYEDMTRERYAAKAKKEEEDRINKIVEERLESERAKLNAPNLTPRTPSFVTESMKSGEKKDYMSLEDEFAEFARDINSAAH